MALTLRDAVKSCLGRARRRRRDGLSFVSGHDQFSPYALHDPARAAQVARCQDFLGCWLADGNAASLVATLKADAMALTLRDAVKSCLAAAQGEGATAEQERLPVVAASAA